MIMYLRMKSEMCPKYFRNIALSTDNSHEFIDELHICAAISLDMHAHS